MRLWQFDRSGSSGSSSYDTTGNVRRGLMKACGRTTFRQKSSNKPEAPISESLEKTIPSRSQSRSNSRKRSSDSTPIAPPLPKRSCLSLRLINPKKSFHNRVHRRVITRYPGRPIYEASSRVAVIKGFIGAISGKYAGIRINDISLTCSGHESLLNAGILHRDVSIGNIILTGKEDDGFLIDLDLAIKTSDNQASNAPSKTRTQFLPGGLIALRVVERWRAILNASEGTNFIRTGFPRSDINFKNFSRAFSSDGVRYC